MKKYLQHQAIGLFWFIIVYALIRSLLAGPLSIQNWDMLAIVLSMIALTWLILRHFNSRKKALGLASSFFIVSLFAAAIVNEVEFVQSISFFNVNILADKGFFQATGFAIAVISLAYLLLTGFSLKEQLAKSSVIWILLGRMVLTFLAVFALELYLMPLIPVA